MFPVEKALDYINVRHVGYLAFVCADGLVFRSDACFVQGQNSHEAAFADKDAWFEEMVTFPIIDGQVDIRAVRDLMGY